ncbi:thiol:disulfide interchange protein DsbD [Mucilaginibacter lappiensis]|uniref:Thiol:disulfide interchange protein DsbD n=1 Tax=Mucilaginibacter lappiensis TaxID=354630 RepID=A0ABR6PCY2_9SPHI|nr:cytochrome c biogenesis protein CcdA [Mucilaginibacter lappiensis]MBB6107615.1 thiol:disulfide interchange protein DsbD [Mucilaginibacter lappiensis]SIQ02772.1 thiol:disulfide interchange protein DsbD [Mucilaginibacter lappiensis]
MKRLYIVIIMITGLLLAKNQLKAQDTASTKGVEFTSIPATTPVVKSTGANKNSIHKQAEKKTIKAGGEHQKQQTLWAIFLAGVAGGLAALLMPCIFPMLPLTVSYFTKSVDKKGSAAGKAVLYGLSIIVIYVVLGLLVTVIFGADALNSLATNGVFNFLFFLLIVIFAASFLGAFEITLPNSWVNKMDQNSDKDGFAGLFFMAATLALVSFSCTGPIIGTLLVQAATTGALLGPAIGMFGFALALATPFVLFAMFPSWLKSLPKSGGWLNSVKVVLGFLELALSLKFLSNVDLAYHWHWFDREIFLVLWIVIFALMGFYLLGKLTFSHDSPLAHISVPRLFLAIIVLSFTMYMVPGLWGAPLKSISAFLPPQSTQDFDLSTIGSANTNQSNSNGMAGTKPHKYADIFDKPKGFNPYFDYDEGIAYAKKVHKPVMIDFTGHACVNCRKMEANVWPDKQVYQRINYDYVLIQLYVDDKTDLTPAEQITTPEGKQIKTVGNKWSYLQTSKFAANSQPFYVLLNPDTEEPLVPPQGADYDPVAYINYLDSGLKAYGQ